MKKSHRVIGTLIGIASLIESFGVYAMTSGDYELSKSYGGDAYTGIQNASAQSANNIYFLTEVVKTGLAAILFIFGITMIFLFATKVLDRKKKEEPVSYPAYTQSQPYPQYTYTPPATAEELQKYVD